MPTTKNEIVDEILQRLGHDVVGATRGSTGYKDALEAIVRDLGLPLDIRLSKPELAQGIVEYAGGTWHERFDSRATPSGGGSTVTVSGFRAVLEALRLLIDPTTEVGLAAAVDRETGGRSLGQGLQRDPALRRATELRAVKLATDHYADLGYDIQDVGTTHSFDLLGHHPSLGTLHAEVKGTTGHGHRINLTHNEVEHAANCRETLSLAIVRYIVVDDVAGTAAEGELHVVEPWDLAASRLRTLTHQYQVWEPGSEPT